jgi:hypothetical protein
VAPTLGGNRTCGESFEKSECAPESGDDCRHRMMVNTLATVVLVALMVTSDWMVNTLAAGA